MDLSWSLTTMLADQTKGNVIGRLSTINKIESALARTLHSDRARLKQARQLLNKLKNDIKQLAIDLLDQINERVFSLNRVIAQPTTTATTTTTATPSRPSPAKARSFFSRIYGKRSVSHLAQLGLEFTVKTLEQTHHSFQHLVELVGSMESKLGKMIGSKHAFAASTKILHDIKELFEKYEIKALLRIHGAILDLNHLLQAPSTVNGPDIDIVDNDASVQRDDVDDNSWLLDELSGKRVVYFKNGEKYAGELVKGKRHGLGTYTFKNGAKYIGEWRHGKANGRGTLFFSSNEKAQRHEGQFVDGMRHGAGVHYFENGNKYVGVWTDDKIPE